jgi:DNA polymerase III alpha subunit
VGEEIVYSPHKYRETEGTKDCKIDLLRVDVVKIIYETFRKAGLPVMSVNELVAATQNDKAVWNLYANGYTMGLNQCERMKTRERVMRFKPKNVVELASFVAAIRPGAKSLVDVFVARQPHTYGIAAMDRLLRLTGATGVTGQSSYLFYDEQILTLAQAAGIEPADAYSLIKHIKKKHHDKVEAYREKFVPGFVHYLEEKEGTEHSLAEKTAGDVWTVILNSASYLFCSAHALAMAYDSLYGAYLKVHYPYEFYSVMLKLYTEKGNKEKIAQIVQEMKAYMDISLIPGQFGQDNRDWYVDKEHRTISQSLPSIKFISTQAAEDLSSMDVRNFKTFADVLRNLQMNTCLNRRQIEVLIGIGYFSPFGRTGKLTRIAEEFYNGKNKVTKTLKSWEKRMEILRGIEAELPDEDLPIVERLRIENDMLGFCRSTDAACNKMYRFVEELDTTYGVKVKLYDIRNGTSRVSRISKNDLHNCQLQLSEIIEPTEWQQRPVCIFRNGKRIQLDETVTWLMKCKTITQRKDETA